MIAHVKAAHEYDMSKPTIIRWRGTLLPLIAPRWELWFFVITHAALVTYNRISRDYGMDMPDIMFLDVYEIPWSVITVPTGLMTFFLVFFNGKCYERFVKYYDAHCAMGGNIQEIAAQTLAAFPVDGMNDDPDRQFRWDACRYLLSSAIVVYMKVSDPPGKPQPIEEEEWQRLMQSEGKWLGEDTEICPPLLNEAEVSVLKGYKGNLQLLLQTWALRVLRQGCFASMQPGEAEVSYVQMEQQVFNLRKACACITNNLAMPIPFPYFHALNLLLVINYALYTYAFLYFETVMSPVVLFLVIVVTLGMREVSTALCNPFGKDEVASPRHPPRPPPPRSPPPPPPPHRPPHPLPPQVDFPVHKYIKNLRALISGLVLHPTIPPGRLTVPRYHKRANSPPPQQHETLPPPPQPAPPPHYPIAVAPPPPGSAKELYPDMVRDYEQLLHMHAQQLAQQYLQMGLHPQPPASPPPLAAASNTTHRLHRGILPPIAVRNAQPVGAATTGVPTWARAEQVFSADGVPVQPDVLQVEVPFVARS